MTERAPAMLDEVLTVLRARREEVRERFKVEMYGIVGSLARGEAGPDSDVDVFAEWLPGSTLFKIGGAMGYLEDELGREVDLIDSPMLRPEMRARMERDFVSL